MGDVKLIKNHVTVNEALSEHGVYSVEKSINVKFGSQFSGKITLQTQNNAQPLVFLPYDIKDEQFIWENGTLVYKAGQREIHLPQNAYVVYFQNTETSQSIKFFKMEKGALKETEKIPAALFFSQNEILGFINQSCWFNPTVDIRTNYEVTRLYNSSRKKGLIFDEAYLLTDDEGFNCILSPSPKSHSSIDKKNEQTHEDYIWYKTADNQTTLCAFLTLEKNEVKKFIKKVQKNDIPLQHVQPKPIFEISNLPENKQGYIAKNNTSESFDQKSTNALTQIDKISKQQEKPAHPIDTIADTEVAFQHYDVAVEKFKQSKPRTITADQSKYYIQFDNSQNVDIAIGLERRLTNVKTNKDLHFNMNPTEFSFFTNGTIAYMAADTLLTELWVEVDTDTNSPLNFNYGIKGSILLNSLNNTVKHYFKESQIYISDITLSYPHGDPTKLAKIHNGFGNDKIYPTYGGHDKKVERTQIIYLDVQNPLSLRVRKLRYSGSDNMDHPFYEITYRNADRPTEGYQSGLLETPPSSSSMKVYKTSENTTLKVRVSVSSKDEADKLIASDDYYNDVMVDYEILSPGQHMDKNLELAACRHRTRITNALGENPYKDRFFIELAIKP